MRRGPHPLPLHIGIALAHHEDQAVYQHKFPCSLRKDELEEMMRGIKMYHAHPYKAENQAKYCIWESDESKLYALGAESDLQRNSKKTPLILIPSLINSCAIMDLSKERSLFRWLNEQGIVTYLFDWGDFNKNNLQNIDTQSIIFKKLGEAVQFVSKVWGKQVDCLGYCMGGTLLIGAQNRVSDCVRRTVLLASPWDFHDARMKLTDHVGLWAPAALPAIERNGHLPNEWVQSLFATLDINGSARKFIKFAALDQESEAAQLFVLVEDWLNEGANLPAHLAKHCIQEWFIRNAPFKKSWMVGNELIDLANVRGDVLIVASEQDKLVPYSAAKNIRNQLINANVEELKLQCGHIGFIAGKSSVRDVWKPIRDWLK